MNERGMAPLFALSLSWQMRRRCEALVDPLANNGNKAISAKSEPDTIDSSVTVH